MAKIQDVMLGKTMRKSFAKHDKILAIPNMLKIQKDSYNWFLDEGLREVFRDVDTITDYTGNLELFPYRTQKLSSFPPTILAG